MPIVTKNIDRQALDTQLIYGSALPPSWLWRGTLEFKKNAKTVETNYLKLFRISEKFEKTNSKRTQNELETNSN